LDCWGSFNFVKMRCFRSNVVEPLGFLDAGLASLLGCAENFITSLRFITEQLELLFFELQGIAAHYI